MPSEISNSDQTKALRNSISLRRSKIEKQKQKSTHANDTSQLFSDKISDQQKIILLKRITIVKDDETVELQIPRDVVTQALEAELKQAFCDVVEEVDTNELRYITT